MYAAYVPEQDSTALSSPCWQLPVWVLANHRGSACWWMNAARRNSRGDSSRSQLCSRGDWWRSQLHSRGDSWRSQLRSRGDSWRSQLRSLSSTTHKSPTVLNGGFAFTWLSTDPRAGLRRCDFFTNKRAIKHPQLTHNIVTRPSQSSELCTCALVRWTQRLIASYVITYVMKLLHMKFHM